MLLDGQQGNFLVEVARKRATNKDRREKMNARKEKRFHYKNNWKLTMRKLHAQMLVEDREWKDKPDNQIRLEDEIGGLGNDI